MGTEKIVFGAEDVVVDGPIETPQDQIRRAKQNLNDKVAEFRKTARELYAERENLRREAPKSGAVRVVDATIKIMAKCSLMIREIVPLASAMAAMSKTLEVFDSVQGVVDTALEAFKFGKPGPFAAIKRSINVNRAVNAIRRKLANMRISFGMYPKFMDAINGFADGIDAAMNKMDKKSNNGEGGSSDLLEEDLRALGIEPYGNEFDDENKEKNNSRKKKSDDGDDGIPDPNDYK